MGGDITKNIWISFSIFFGTILSALAGKIGIQIFKQISIGGCTKYQPSFDRFRVVPMGMAVDETSLWA